MNDKSFTLHGGLIASLSGAVKTASETSAERLGLDSAAQRRNHRGMQSESSLPTIN